MPRPSRDNELLYILLRKPQGATFNELVTLDFEITRSNGQILIIRKFTRKTLDRLLKELAIKKLVENSLEPRTKGKKGRQAKRYKISSRIMTVGKEQNIGLGLTVQEFGYGITFPHKKIRGMPFRGIYVTRYGKTFVRLLPNEKIRMERFITWLKKLKKE